jgi:PAS domain-containing protein
VNVERIQQKQTVETFDARVRTGGAEQWLSITLSPVKNASGNVIGISMVARDITARRQAEAALATSEEQFRRAVEEAPIPVIMHAEDGQVLQVSKAWMRLTGYRPEDIPTLEAWLGHAHGSGGFDVRDHVQRLFSGRRSTSPPNWR